MWVLGIDTAAAATGVCLSRAGGVVAADQAGGREHHSRRLVALIAAVFARADVEPGCLDRIAVVSGPGSFTGLRVGLATANGLGWALARPVIGVSSLAAVAAHYGAAAPEPVVVPVLDARRGEVFVARFERDADGDLRRASEDRVLAPEAAFRLAPAGSLVVGDGAARYREQLRGVQPDCRREAGGESVAAAVAALGAAVAAAAIRTGPAPPRYLRAPHLRPTEGVPHG